MISYSVRFLVLVSAFLLTAAPAAANLDYATFVGGSSSDSAIDVDLDSSGNIVILGATWSPDFPITPGAFDPTFDHDVPPNVVIVKLTADLSTLIGATYLSGAACGTDPMTEALDLLVGLDDTVNICGWTWCSTFPTTPDSYMPDHTGLVDGFLVQLSADLTSMLYGTFTGDEYHSYTYESCNALAMDSDGWIYLAGYSEDWKYVQQWSPDLYSFGVGQGGLWKCHPLALVVNQVDGTVYMAGTTSDATFETTPGAWDTSHNGRTDYVVRSFNANMAMQASTFIGGPDHDGGSETNEGLRDFILAENGDLLLAGSSDSSAFPVTTGAYDTSLGGSSDGFILRMSADLSSLIACTYLGGLGDDSVGGFGVTERGNVALVGRTGSSDFPTSPGAWDTGSVGTDGFVAELSGNLDRLIYSSFIGGDTGTDELNAMQIDGAGRVVAAGTTYASDFPTTPGAHDTGLDGSRDMVALVFDIPRVRANLLCTPDSGTLPFTTQFNVSLTNLEESIRRIAGRIDVQLASGSFFPNWRAGYTTVAGQDEFSTSWNQNFPALGSLQGENVFTLRAEDVTPAPYNQPPFAPSGEQSTDSCTITGH